MKERTEETGVVVEEELLSNMIKTAKDLKTHFQSKGVHSPEGITRYYEDQGFFDD